jgi:hypothetical protein
MPFLSIHFNAWFYKISKFMNFKYLKITKLILMILAAKSILLDLLDVS